MPSSSVNSAIARPHVARRTPKRQSPRGAEAPPSRAEKLTETRPGSMQTGGPGRRIYTCIRITSSYAATILLRIAIIV